MQHPHQRALATLGWLVGLALLATPAAWGLFASTGGATVAIVWICAGFLILFAFMYAVIWALGAAQMRQARAFLESERVLVCWTYSPAEWRQVKDTLWQEEKDDWKVQFGCLTALFALSGLLAGIMIGWEEGGLEAIAGGLLGMAIGGMTGGAFGAVVAGSSHWSARKAHQRPDPGMVALGVNEVFASDDYFRGNGVNSYIREARLIPGTPVTLELEIIVPPRPRSANEEQWAIPVPAQWVALVEALLPRLAPKQISG